ncbi:hypothetical protein [Clostridium butyricum]|uniref:hypothetical protein n=1 Tax=Clostridium butyricum TaxID=1492 RepID=UPI00374F68AA
MMKKGNIKINGKAQEGDIKDILMEINYCEFCNNGSFNISFQSSSYDCENNITKIDIEILFNKNINIEEKLNEMINCEFCQNEIEKIYIELKYTDKEIEELWRELEDVTTIENEDGELILNSDWFIFSKGTESSEIWEWFNRKHTNGLRYLVEEIA